jgi:hypothetical protein
VAACAEFVGLGTLMDPEKVNDPERSILAAVTTLFARYAALSMAPSAILALTTESFARAELATTDAPRRFELLMIPVANWVAVMLAFFI